MISLTIEKPKGTRRGDTVAPPTWRQALTAGLGIVIRRRRQIHGDPGADGRSAWKGALYVRPDVRGASAGRLTNWGAYRFAGGLQEYHDSLGVVPGSHNVTGGMWRGFSLVPDGRGGSLKFRGGSPSYKVNPKTLKSGKTTWQRSRADNALKAWVCFSSSRGRDHVLQYTVEEVQAMRGAVQEMVRRELSRAAGGIVQWDRETAAERGHGIVFKYLVSAADKGTTTV